MPNTGRLERLLSKANDLPLSSGVYIMKDRTGKVIYVGKSKKLKNRVSQYFRMGQKNRKTERMVASVEDFDVIFVDGEMEALTLENVLIKKYSPRYNIRLKDAKSYPYIKIDVSSPFPRLTMTRNRALDKARYFGPYQGTADVYHVIDMLNRTLGLAGCKRVFPRDIGKERPCIYREMHRCVAPCTGEVSSEEYRKTVKEAIEILQGNIGEAKRSIEARMYAFAEQEQYEAAALCRDSIASLEKMKQKQKVVASPDAEYDVVGLYEGELLSAISVFEVRGGALLSKEDFLLGADEIVEEDTLLTFLIEYYSQKDGYPKEILVANTVEAEELEALAALLSERAGHRIAVRVPERGEKAKLAAMARENAEEKVRLETVKERETSKVLSRLSELLRLECYPERIEAYDISNIGQEYLTCGMIVVENGKFKKKDYRTFRIRTVTGTDDYASMREAIGRRLAHLSDADGSYSRLPDLILLDGGVGHVNTVRELLSETENNMVREIPVYGMVKDEHHKTRALTDGMGDISIAREVDVFRLIYGIQEEVHRYSVGKMSNAKRKTLRHSELEKIKGIGEAKAKKLLSVFGSLDVIRKADETELMEKGVCQRDAKAIVAYFGTKEPEADTEPDHG